MTIVGSKNPYFERIIIVLTFLGLLTTIHLWIMSERGFDRGCLGFTTSQQFEQRFDCESVLESDFGRLFGIRNVYIGMLYYSLITLLSLLIYSIPDSRQRIFKAVRLLAISLSFVASAVLTLYQVLWLKELCALCLTSAAINTLLFIASIIYWKMHPLKLAIRGEQLRFFSSAIFIVMLLGVGDIIYFNSLGNGKNLSPKKGIDFESLMANKNEQITASDTLGEFGCLYRDDKPYLENYKELVTHFDIKAGNLDSDIIIIEYFDPNCYHCKGLFEIMMEAKEKFADKALFVFKPNPLWQQSVFQIQALLIASEENLFFEMLRKQFIFQTPSTGLDLKQILEIAKEIGMDEINLARRMNRGDYMQYILEQYEIRRANKITSVPAIIINGWSVEPKSFTLKCIEKFIEEQSKMVNQN